MDPFLVVQDMYSWTQIRVVGFAYLVCKNMYDYHCQLLLLERKVAIICISGREPSNADYI